MKKLASTFVFSALTLAVGAAAAQSQPVIGLITKTESNPFFVKMKEGADAEAKKLGAKLIAAAGKTDGDNAGQVTAMENMIAAGAKTILITPSDAKAIIPAIKKAQQQGVMVIALDSPTDPASAVDALFATDNYKAGVLIGQYAKAALGGKKPVIATLDLFPGHPVGAQRHNGFLKGFGLSAPDAKSNELGGKAAGKEKDVLIVSVDGGCAGVKDVGAGVIAATSQQYPLRMAAMGVAAGVEYAKTGKKVSGYTDTGVTLIAGKPVAGVDSKDVKTGMDLCWGNK